MLGDTLLAILKAIAPLFLVVAGAVEQLAPLFLQLLSPLAQVVALLVQALAPILPVIADLHAARVGPRRAGRPTSSPSSCRSSPNS